jgi:hypothetical protein
MRGHDRKRTVWQQALILLLALGGAGYSLFTSEAGPLDSENLRTEVAEVRALGAEAAMMSQAMLTGRTTPDYEQAQVLLNRDNAKQAWDTLNSVQVERGLEGELVQSRELAQQVTRAFELLSTARGNPQLLARIKSEMEQLVVQALAVEESLKQKPS